MLREFTTHAPSFKNTTSVKKKLGEMPKIVLGGGENECVGKYK